jgi:hypothetical protein
MSSFIRNLRYGVRLSLRSPGFTLLAVLTLGLGAAPARRATRVSPMEALRAER